LHNVICLEGSIGLPDRLRCLTARATESSFSVTTSRENLTSVLTLCNRLQPALLVIEADEAERLGIERIRKSLPPHTLHILVVCPVDDNSLLELYLRLGCNGVVPATASDETLWRAVQAIFEGELWVPRKLLSRLVQNALFREPGRNLTKRELEVLKLICSGCTNQEIADDLFISRETIRWHLRSLYSKIGVKDRESAIRYALAIGFKARSTSEF
jgi:NarL family two-component system response regulator LiaR